MTNINVNELAELAKAALKQQKDGQEFLLTDVHNITRQAYERFSEDPVIRQFAFVIERKMEHSTPGATINQGEMSDIYNSLARTAGNNRFREALGMFLNTAQAEHQLQNEDFVRLNRVDAEDSHLNPNDFSSEYLDQDLVNDLDSAFGGSLKENRIYNSAAANKGKEFVEVELESLGFKPRVEILGGNRDTLMYNAHLDTLKGLVSVAIPLDISQGKVLLPSTFVADDHLEELTSANLQSFIDNKGTPEALDKKTTESKADIDTTPQVDMPKELAHLAQDFENDVVEAASAFGKSAIRSGKNIVLAELLSAGFRNAQVRFGGDGGDSAIYLAVIATPQGTVEIEVPVEMQAQTDNSYRALSPSHFAYDGLLEDFTPAKLQRFALNLPQPSSVYSPSHVYMTLPELRNEIVKSASKNDLLGCEMILGTIREKFTEEDYKNAVADYHYLLMLKSNSEKEEHTHTCSKMIAAGKGSIEARCGHFGVPMSQVITAEDGSCILKSSLERERLNPVDESGAAISSNKLFWT